MNTVLKKVSLDEKTSRNFIAILLIAIGGVVIYGLPYLRYDYYDIYMDVYNLTDTEMKLLGSVLSTFGMISYLVGGIIADKISVRKILTFSFIGTGVGGLFHLLPLDFIELVVLYAFWGASSLFAFWPACIKCVRLLSDPQKRGKAFGFFEGARGIITLVISTIIIMLLRYKAGTVENNEVLMKSLIIFYSVLIITIGIATYITMKDEKIKNVEKLTIKDIGQVIRIDAIWIIGIIGFCNSVLGLSVYYLVPYSTGFLGLPISFVSTLLLLKGIVGIIGSIGGGHITDKLGSGNVILASFFIMTISIMWMLLLKFNQQSGTVFVVIFIIIITLYNVNNAMLWTMMDQGNIDEKHSGIAVGLICTVGHVAEMFFPIIGGIYIGKDAVAEGYRHYFTFVMIILALGFITSLYWKSYIKKEEKKRHTLKI